MWGKGCNVPSPASSKEVMNSGVRFIICKISSVVWDRTESIWGGIAGSGVDSLEAFSGRGKGVDAIAAAARGACEDGGNGGLG